MAVDELLPTRLTSEVQLIELEQQLLAALNRALKKWLPVARAAVLPTEATALTAAAQPPQPNELMGTAHVWTQAVEGEVMPAVGAVFRTGIANATPALNDAELAPSKQMTDAYLAEVANRISRLPNDAWQQLSGKLAAAIRAGSSPTQLADLVKQVLTPLGLKNDVTAIARTEATAAFNAGQVGAWQYSDSLTGEKTDKVWVCTHDLRTRPAHRAADLQRVALADPFIVGGVPMMYPGWPAAPPSLVVNCRCSMLNVVSGDPMPGDPRTPWRDIDAGLATRSRPAPKPPIDPELLTHVEKWHTRESLKDPAVQQLLKAVDAGYDRDKLTVLSGYGDENPGRTVAEVTYADGTKAFIKQSSVDDIEREQLSAALGRQMGVPVAATLRVQNDEYVSLRLPGRPAADHFGVDDTRFGTAEQRARWAELQASVGDDTPEGLRLSFFDTLIDEGDRHLYDVIVDSKGVPTGGVDQEFAWSMDEPFSQARRAPNVYGTYIGSRWFDLRQPQTGHEDPFGTWKQNPLTDADVTWLKQQMLVAKPQFTKLGHEDWWQFSWDRLDEMAKYASGVTNLFAPLTASLDDDLRWVDEWAVFHLPGQHDQRTHGNRGGGPPLTKMIKLNELGDEGGLEQEFDRLVAGTYGGLHMSTTRVSASNEPDGDGVFVSARIAVLDSKGSEVGNAYVQIAKDEQTGRWYLDEPGLALSSSVQGGSFATEFFAKWTKWAQANKLTHVQITADIDVGGYAWAAQGWDWASASVGKRAVGRWVDRIRKGEGGGGSGGRLLPIRKLTPDEKAQLSDIEYRAEHEPFGSPGFPRPLELAQFGREAGQGGRAAQWPGKGALMGMSYAAVIRFE